MYLAAIADAQPQTPTMPSQMSSQHPGMQQGGYYMQPQQPQGGAAMAGGIFSPLNNPHHHHHHQLQDPHPQMTITRPNNGINNNNATNNTIQDKAADAHVIGDGAK
ncbi:hypothetical protein ABFS83_14G131300 [Erythranthe nasuta]